MRGITVLKINMDKRKLAEIDTSSQEVEGRMSKRSALIVWSYSFE